MTTNCPNCSTPLGPDTVWKALAASETGRGLTRCGSCAAYLKLAPASVAATIGVAIAALLLLTPVHGMLRQTGGLGLVVVISLFVGVAALICGYLLTARFQIHQVRRFEASWDA